MLTPKLTECGKSEALQIIRCTAVELDAHVQRLLQWTEDSDPGFLSPMTNSVSANNIITRTRLAIIMRIETSLSFVQLENVGRAYKTLVLRDMG